MVFMKKGHKLTYVNCSLHPQNKQEISLLHKKQKNYKLLLKSLQKQFNNHNMNVLVQKRSFFKAAWRPGYVAQGSVVELVCSPQILH